jgi:hypothetical protein
MTRPLLLRPLLLLALLLAACGQRGGTEGAYVGGSAGANYRAASPLR